MQIRCNSCNGRLRWKKREQRKRPGLHGNSHRRFLGAPNYGKVVHAYVCESCGKADR